MPDNVMSDIYSLNEMPWHKHAFVSTKEMGAVEAASVIEGVFYEKRPVTVFLNGVQQEKKDFAIVRSAIPSHPEERILGFVKKNYNILQPLDICQEFDDNVGAPVETLGFLGNGEKLFMTWHLPGFDVNGDEIKLYGFVASGYDGKFGSSLYVVTVRVVCSNTFAMAVTEGETTTKEDKKDGRGKVWSGRHNSLNLSRDLGVWMEHVQGRAVSQSTSLASMFAAMANKPIVNTQSLTSLLFKIYPDPKPLPADYPSRIRAEKQEKIDVLAAKAERDRAVISDLFGGQGIEITPDGWGLFNAVTQYENHVRVTKKPSDYSVILGNRSNTMNKAAQVISTWAKK